MFGGEAQFDRVTVTGLLKRCQPVCPERDEIEIGWSLKVFAGQFDILNTPDTVDARLAAGIQCGTHQVPDAGLCYQTIRVDRTPVDGVVIAAPVGQVKAAVVPDSFLQ